jgi:hypothetical protein
MSWAVHWGGCAPSFVRSQGSRQGLEAHGAVGPPQRCGRAAGAPGAATDACRGVLSALAQGHHTENEWGSASRAAAKAMRANALSHAHKQCSEGQRRLLGVGGMAVLPCGLRRGDRGRRREHAAGAAQQRGPAAPQQPQAWGEKGGGRPQPAGRRKGRLKGLSLEGLLSQGGGRQGGAAETPFEPPLLPGGQGAHWGGPGPGPGWAA